MVKSIEDLAESNPFFSGSDGHDIYNDMQITYHSMGALKEKMPSGSFAEREMKIMMGRLLTSIRRIESKASFRQFPKIPQELLDHMIVASEKCIRKYPSLADHPYLCENVYLSPQQDNDSYDLHTHTIHDNDQPSNADLKTHQNLKKKHLCIVNSVDRTLSCYVVGKDGSLTRSKKSV